MKRLQLDKEEREVLKSFEAGKWQPVKDLKGEILRHRQYARSTLLKDRRVNIRISSKDLDEIKAIAVSEGVPYQTLMGSVIHKYIAVGHKGRSRRNKKLKASR